MCKALDGDVFRLETAPAVEWRNGPLWFGHVHMVKTQLLIHVYLLMVNVGRSSLDLSNGVWGLWVRQPRVLRRLTMNTTLILLTAILVAGFFLAMYLDQNPIRHD